MSRWFRHYAGMMRDEKLVAVAIRAKQPVHLVTWIWGAILESAAEKDDNGLYEIDAAEVAYFLRTDEGDVGAILDGLAKAGRVAANRVVKWGDRQYQSDKSAERQARYRERKRAPVTVSNGEQTHQSDVTPPSPDRHVTPQETELETDTPLKPPKGGDNRRRPVKGQAALTDYKRKLEHENERENQGSGSDIANAGGVAVFAIADHGKYG